MANGQPMKLSELTGSLETWFEKRFKGRQVQVIAEVSNHKAYPSRQWHFFDLIEKAPGADRLVAKMNAVAWRPGFLAIEQFEKTAGQRFTDGIEVLLTCELAFNGQYGLKLNVIDIDPAYTMGQMERRRRETLQRLVLRNPRHVQLKDGAYVTSNQGVLNNVVIRRIAVISSPGAAGYEDFMHTLTNNAFGYTFSIDAYYARVQGLDAAPMLARRLAEIASQPDNYDLVVIIRGGGAQTDLFVFDDYVLNREIAMHPIPVWTGIGHQRDVTIADLFAHTAHKTPTKVAEAILHLNRSAEERVAFLRERLLASAREGVKNKRQALSKASLTLTGRAPALIRDKNKAIIDLTGRMRAAARRSVEHTRSELNSSRRILATHGRFALLNAERSVAEVKKRLEPLAQRQLRRHAERLEALRKMVALADPERVVKRGFALIRFEGKVITSAAELPLGAKLDLQLKQEALSVTLDEVRRMDQGSTSKDEA